MNRISIKYLAYCSAAGAALLASPVFAKDVSACLITKTDTNPYFVTMKKGAEQTAKKLGVDLKTYAGKYDGDNQTQVDDIETCIADGVNGILITASDTKAIVPAVEKARKAGILVVALDTTLQPTNAADVTFATDNFEAGKLIGEWAKKRLGNKKAHIAFLDLAVSQPSVGVQRDQGFMQGFGIDIKDKNKWGDETDPRIVGHDVTGGAEDGGRKAMENLLQKDPSTNLVYAINEPAAAGAYQALKAVGLQDQATIVAIDGGCPGVKNVQEGIIGATSQQYPLLMASKGIEAVKTYVETGKKPQNSPGLDFVNTGVNLVTDHPVKGVKSIDTKEGLKRCWG
ncbi:sugar ABC transporter substrate-binding protein [Salinisphaera hydrothermalis]|uniref:ABC-type sugar transport system, periplasmic component n=1 Tax=Salinisphaera hydrothermalis (strain C41B8) TaxID=1304275 RepID=A0A084IMN5_SALHC|nr:sugar ABC transporter substrate-binding protein [Salinisphaera hydrothermalis]KEZ77969.1 ABC-type sugar transport system, periplasmic component [Salinisphaera hydrothermalis C41B8]